MNLPVLIKTKECTNQNKESINLDWIDNNSVKNILDVISTIIAEEYIQVARQNQNIFSEELTNMPGLT